VTTVLAVSPHLDDAVFSAGALLWRLARRGVRVVIATVFTGNVANSQGFALSCQLDKGLGPGVDYMALRRAEDEAACAILGAEPRHLPLLEAPHRGYISAPDLFAGVHDDDREVHSEVRSRLTDLMTEFQPDWVLGPSGIGNHVDHLVVRDALDAFRHPRQWWWEDWPYAVRERRETTLQPGREMAVGSAARAEKFGACAAYRSQLGFQFGGPQALADLLATQTRERYFASLDGTPVTANSRAPEPT
jgi:LmbE family N-acetylglucosaminyl deacetylase